MLGKKLRTEDDRIKAAAKARKKKRKKMIKTKYGQKAVRHSKRGVYSCTYAVVIAFLVIVMILFSFMNKGNVNILMGFFGLGTCAMAVIGIWLGIKGFREREKIYTTLQGWNHSKCGIPCCYGCIICQGAYVDDRRKI